MLFRSSVGAASSAWTGIAGGSEGREIVVVNVGPSILRVENQDAASAAPNRIITGTGAAVLLVTDDPAVLRYDSIRQRWRILT